ncbi:hypothetical protein QCD79_33360 [Pseudomonas quasicaspiana]|nr:hypothetical protein [Pseudomonas quasicaspiana]
MTVIKQDDLIQGVGDALNQVVLLDHGHVGALLCLGREHSKIIV